MLPARAASAGKTDQGCGLPILWLSRPLPSLANRTTLPAMVDTMVIRVPLLTTYATVKHVDVSLPLVACLLLDGEKYMDPRDVRPAAVHLRVSTLRVNCRHGRSEPERPLRGKSGTGLDDYASA
jgi:hypothetical protein